MFIIFISLLIYHSSHLLTLSTLHFFISPFYLLSFLVVSILHFLYKIPTHYLLSFLHTLYFYIYILYTHFFFFLTTSTTDLLYYIPQTSTPILLHITLTSTVLLLFCNSHKNPLYSLSLFSI